MKIEEEFEVSGGRLIVIEGVNNTGKTTLAEALVKWLNDNGEKAICMKYPDYNTETGIIISNYLRYPESEKSSSMTPFDFQMINAENKIERQSSILEYIRQGYWVVIENYAGAGMAWGSADNLNLEDLIEMNKSLLVADITFLIHGRRFLGAVEDKHIYENNHDKTSVCQEVFLDFAKGDYYNRSNHLGNWAVISNDSSPEVILQRVICALKDYLRSSNSALLEKD